MPRSFDGEGMTCLKVFFSRNAMLHLITVFYNVFTSSYIHILISRSRPLFIVMYSSFYGSGIFKLRLRIL